MQELPPNIIFEDRYKIQKLIASGRMSSVYVALDQKRKGDIVAIKLLDTDYDDQILRELFRRETESLSRLSHPNVVRLLDRGFSSALHAFYLVLEYLPGNLKSLLEKKPVFCQNPNWIWPFVRSVAEGLAHAHSEGIIHRDIKPSNILLDEENQPKITDFGISRLKYKLSVGKTLSSFWSPGYAAPEQCRGEDADTWSDIYSLGAVCYEIFSGHPPRTEGILNEDVSKLGIPENAKLILSKMLSVNYTDRFQRVSDLLVELEKTHRLESPRSCFLVVTEAAKQKLYQMGFIKEMDHASACECLIEDLGGQDVQQTNVMIERNGDFTIIGQKLRLTCAVDEHSSALVIKGLHCPYPPTMEKQRESSLSIRVLWDPVGKSYFFEETDGIQESGDTVSWLYDQATEHNRIASADASRRQQKRQFMDTWDKVLHFQQSRIEKQSPTFAYVNVRESGGNLVFHLAEPIPDNLGWDEDTPIAILEEELQRRLLAGTILEIRGDTLIINPHSTKHRAGIGSKGIPKNGLLSRDLSEALTSIHRQQVALSVFRAKEIPNPRMFDVLTDLGRAEFQPINKDLKFFQKWLSKDKKEIICKALSTQDLFMLRGPPGTGKTAVIAEIIAQILELNPYARVLVTSQSNIAVDHVLSQVSVANPAISEMVRVGRQEKVGHEADLWLIEARRTELRKQIETHCNSVLERLRQEQRVARTQKDENEKSGVKDPVQNVIETFEEWLEEAGIQIEMLKAYEQEWAILTREVGQISEWSVDVLEDKKRALKEIEGVITDQRKGISDYLDTVRSLLPRESQGERDDNIEREYHRLRRIVTHASRAADPSARWSNLTQLVKDWIKVFGLTDDFDAMITKRARVLAATCLFSAGRITGDQIFDWVIVDEAGRATAPELLVPLVRSQRAILVGDERQLPPFLDEEINEANLRAAGVEVQSRAQLERSLFQELVQQATETHPDMVAELREQYRMHPAIGRLVSEVFYDGKLEHGVKESERDHGLAWIPKPVVWYSTVKIIHRRETKVGLTYSNHCEATIIEELLKHMELDYSKTKKKMKVGVISGYSGQISELVTRIDADNMALWKWLDIQVATVDSFQGQDRDLIIYSTVRSNKTGEIGFLKDRRRVNVALSRAKSLLIVVGDHSMMEHASIGGAGNPFTAVLSYIHNNSSDCAIVDWDGQ